MDFKPSSVPAQEQEEQPGKEHEMSPKPEVIRESYRGSGKLKDKVAIITGGDSGIGRSVSVHFAREGADIAIIYLNEDKDAEATKQMVINEGRKCILLKGDVGNEFFCAQAVEQVIKKFGKLNIVVNNAGEQHEANSLEEISEQQLEKTFRTNIFGYFFLAKASLKHLKQGDAIINCTSVTAYRGSGHLMDYASTKGAIVSFTRSLAANLGPKGIRVNGVAPGPIWTPLIPASFDKEKVKEFGKNTLMGRPGQPSEVSPSFVFLASEDSSYMSGQVLHPNGGDPVES